MKNHVISEKLLAAMFDRSRAFFSLPMEDKMRIHINSHNRGYTRVRMCCQLHCCMHSITKRLPAALVSSWMGRRWTQSSRSSLMARSSAA